MDNIVREEGEKLMTNPNGASTEKEPTSPPPPPAAVDLENQAAAAEAIPPAAGSGYSGILRRWKREDLLKKGSLVLRGAGLLFSLLAFIIMACNKHGDWENFDKYEEYRYVLATAILSTMYTGLQVFRQVRELSTGKEIFPRLTMAAIDFFGDQIFAYLLISSVSAAVPMTNRMREGSDNIFTDTSATAIGMEFFAFILLALSALVSGYKLSHQTYI